MRSRYWIYLAVLAAVGVAAVWTYAATHPAPSLDWVPSPVYVGEQAWVAGYGFSAADNTLRIGSMQIRNLPATRAGFEDKSGNTSDEQSMGFTVPSTTPGTYAISVTTPYGTSNVESIEIRPVRSPPTPPPDPPTPAPI